MFCTNCGTKIDDGAKVCPQCGVSLEASTPAAPLPPSPQPAQASVSPPQGAPAPAGAAVGKLLKNKAVLGGIAAVLVLVIVLAVVLSQPKTVNLDELITVEFSGYDTVGTAYAHFDEEALNAQLAKALNSEKASLSSLEGYLACRGAISLSLDQAQNLSNGDEVVVNVDYNNEAVKNYKVKFTGGSHKFTVEGLEPVKEIDPFADLKISFSGISPNGSVEYTYEGSADYLSQYSFQSDKTSGLRNGDTITVTLPGFETENTVHSGYRLTEQSKTYTVEGLDEYVDSYEDLPEEFLNHVKQESEDIISAYIAQSYNKECPTGELEYAGYAFMCVKSAEDAYNGYNRLIVFLRTKVSHTEGSFPDTVVYYPVSFPNILSSGGKITCQESEGILGSSRLGDGSYSTRGYSSPLLAYKETVTPNVDKCVVETGDGFEKYESYTPIAKLSDISQENMKMLTDKATDAAQAVVADVSVEKTSAKNMAVKGQYLLVNKAQGDDFAENNQLIIVLSATVTTESVNSWDKTKTFEDTVVYFPVIFSGVVNVPGDEFAYVTQSRIQGSASLRGEHGGYSIRGYTDGASMFSDLVTAKRTNYTYEVSDGLQEFGK